MDDGSTRLDHGARISGNYEDAEARAVSGDSYHATRCKSQVATHFGPTLLYVPPFYVIPFRPSSLPVFSFVLPPTRFQTRSAGANYFSRSQSRSHHHSSTLTTISGFISQSVMRSAQIGPKPSNPSNNSYSARSGGGGADDATASANERALQAHHSSSTVLMLENALAAVRNDASQLPLSDLVHASTMIRDLESMLRERLSRSRADDDENREY